MDSVMIKEKFDEKDKERLHNYFLAVLNHYCETSYTNRGGWTKHIGIRSYNFENVVKHLLDGVDKVINKDDK